MSTLFDLFLSLRLFPVHSVCSDCTASRAECYLGSRGLHRTPRRGQPARSHGQQQTFKLATTVIRKVQGAWT